MSDLNLDLVRAEFPALNDDCIYLDNAGGSQVLKRVAERVTQNHKPRPKKFCLRAVPSPSSLTPTTMKKS